MRRLLEIDKDDALTVLTVTELRAIIKNILPTIYDDSVAELINDMSKRETEKKALADLAQKLMVARFAKTNRAILTLDVNEPTEMPTDPQADKKLVRVQSGSRPGHFHIVTLIANQPVHCSCESFLYNSEKGKMYCKHFKEV